ncbi:MAG: hypothetical protein WDN75_09510 [Bacteroidota bacterium]
MDRPLNHVQLTRQEKDEADGTKSKTLYKYPQDYAAGVPELSNINALKAAHIYSTPVEIQNWKVKEGASSMISGMISDFESSTFNPARIYVFKSASPATTLNNETTSGGLFNTLLSDNSKYELRAQMNYAAGRVISQNKDKDINKSYIWGYSNTQPIAEVTNADQSLIAFTSFEEQSDGNWVIASSSRDATNFFTGTNGYSLSSGNVVKSGLDASRTYVVSFWTKTGSATVNGAAPIVKAAVGGWSLNVISVSGTAVTIAGTAVIDELRLYPQNAMMTSYCFDPLVGVTSITDSNNQVNYYVYDTFKRLQLIRDYQGNILKRYTYSYTQR